jgi:hypothetical protein
MGSYAASLLNDLSKYRSPCALRTHLGLEGAWLLSTAPKAAMSAAWRRRIRAAVKIEKIQRAMTVSGNIARCQPSCCCRSTQSKPLPGSAFRPGAMCSWPATKAMG